MTVCRKCGKPIRFIRKAGDRNALAVDAAAVYYLPPDGRDREETFINPSGNAVTGRRAPDGIKGYTMHDCGRPV
jgi:hypothetical protein